MIECTWHNHSKVTRLLPPWMVSLLPFVKSRWKTQSLTPRHSEIWSSCPPPDREPPCGAREGSVTVTIKSTGSTSCGAHHLSHSIGDTACREMTADWNGSLRPVTQLYWDQTQSLSITLYLEENGVSTGDSVCFLVSEYAYWVTQWFSFLVFLLGIFWSNLSLSVEHGDACKLLLRFPFFWPLSCVSSLKFLLKKIVSLCKLPQTLPQRGVVPV